MSNLIELALMASTLHPSSTRAFLSCSVCGRKSAEPYARSMNVAADQSVDPHSPQYSVTQVCVPMRNAIHSFLPCKYALSPEWHGFMGQLIRLGCRLCMRTGGQHTRLIIFLRKWVDMQVYLQQSAPTPYTACPVTAYTRSMTFWSMLLGSRASHCLARGSCA